MMSPLIAQDLGDGTESRHTRLRRRRQWRGSRRMRQASCLCVMLGSCWMQSDDSGHVAMCVSRVASLCEWTLHQFKPISHWMRQIQESILQLLRPAI